MDVVPHKFATFLVVVGEHGIAMLFHNVAHSQDGFADHGAVTTELAVVGVGDVRDQE